MGECEKREKQIVKIVKDTICCVKNPSVEKDIVQLVNYLEILLRGYLLN